MCDWLCDVFWYVFFVTGLFLRVFNLFVWFVSELSCDVVCVFFLIVVLCASCVIACLSAVFD